MMNFLKTNLPINKGIVYMEKSDLLQKNDKKLKKQNVHVKLTFEELSALDEEMARIGIDSRSAMGRILIRKALGLNG